MSAIRLFFKTHLAFLLPLVNWFLGFRYRNKSINEIFQSIHNKNSWQDNDSVSGQGSNFEQTRIIRESIPTLLKQYQITSLLDIPCGDFYWLSKTELPIARYIGADIVPQIIQKNTEHYASETCSFISLDIISDGLPKVDLILCRDCLVHFSFENIHEALQQIKKSGTKWLLTTTFTNANTNTNIQPVAGEN